MSSRITFELAAVLVFAVPTLIWALRLARSGSVALPAWKQLIGMLALFSAVSMALVIAPGIERSAELRARFGESFPFFSSWGFEIFICLAPLLVSATLRRLISFRTRWTWAAVAPLLVAANDLANYVANGQSAHAWDILMHFAKGFRFAFREELLYRGYPFIIRPEARPRMMIVASSVIFGMMHAHPNMKAGDWLNSEDWLRFAELFFAGLSFGLIRVITNGLGTGMLLHGFIDTVRIAESGTHSISPRFHLIFDLLFAALTLPFLIFHPKLSARHAEPGKIPMGKNPAGNAPEPIDSIEARSPAPSGAAINE